MPEGTTTEYDPEPGRYARWKSRGVLAVEMECAALYTVGALRGAAAACLLAVSDVVAPDGDVRIADADLRDAVERMIEVALAAVTGTSVE